MATGIKGDTPRIIDIPPSPWTLGENEVPQGYARPLYRYTKGKTSSTYVRIGTVTDKAAAEALMYILEN